VRATSGFVRLFIRGLAWDAKTAGRSFADTLEIAAKARLTESGKGKVLTGTASGGTSVSFTLPPLGSLNADDVAEVCSRLLDEVDLIVGETPSISDDQLKMALLAVFPAIRSLHPDFSGLRR
jgi:hypothetical protein